MKNIRGTEIDYIIMHHSLTKDSLIPNWHAIRRYHMSTLGWNDIGYHFGVEMLGDVAESMIGRSPYLVGAHTRQKKMNYRSLGVCVVGAFDEYCPPDVVWDKTIKLVAGLCLTFQIQPQNIKAHRDFTPYKTCPGKMFDMNRLRYDAKMMLGRLMDFP